MDRRRPRSPEPHRPKSHEPRTAPHEPQRASFHEPRARVPAPAHDQSDVVQGVHAGFAVLERRRDDVLRVLYAPALRRDLGEFARWAASHGVECAEAGDAEIDRLAGSSHHEGLCVITRPRRWAPAQELADALTGAPTGVNASPLRGSSHAPGGAEARTQRPGGHDRPPQRHAPRSEAPLARLGERTAVALDRVRNPYNVGAILRSAAFFGLEGAILGAPAPDPGLHPTAVRVAEGAAERVRLARTTDLAETLSRLRSRGVRVVGADARGAVDALEFTFERPVILVVGHEREGLADRVRAQCDAIVAIRGNGSMDSLNVAVASGVLIAAMTRNAIR